MGSHSGDEQNKMNTDEQKRQQDQYNAFIAMLKNTMNTGGDPNSPAGKATSGYEDFAKTGGFDPSSIPQISGPDAATRNAIMGFGLFNKAASSPTGLMTPEQLQDIRLRQASANSSAYDSLKDDLEQRNRASGNLTPGVYTASLGQMARDKAHAIQSGTLAAETGIADTENNQRMWGANSGSTAGLGLGNLDFNVANANSRNYLTGAGLNQAGREFGISGLNGVNQDYIKAILGAMGQEGSGQSTLIGQNMQYNPKKSIWDTLIDPLIGAGGAALGTYLGGGRSAPSSSGYGGAVGGFNGTPFNPSAIPGMGSLYDQEYRNPLNG